MVTTAATARLIDGKSADAVCLFQWHAELLTKATKEQDQAENNPATYHVPAGQVLAGTACFSIHVYPCVCLH